PSPAPGSSSSPTAATRRHATSRSSPPTRSSVSWRNWSAMSDRIYTLPIEQTRWKVPSGNTTVFSWEYDEGYDRLLSLYEKGKDKQWNSNHRIDWDTPVDIDDPKLVPDEYVPIFGSSVWDRLGPQERQRVKQHVSSWQFSQFLHGE